MGSVMVSGGRGPRAGVQHSPARLHRTTPDVVVACRRMRVSLRSAFAISYTLGMSQSALVAARVDPSGARVRKVAQTWAATLCDRAGLRVVVEGGEGVAWDDPLVVMSTHASHFDIPVLWKVLPHPFGMLAKKELFDIPVFGRAMTAVGCVPIDRADPAFAHEAIRDAAIGASSFSDWWAYKYEVIDAIPHAGSLLHRRGVVVSFNSDSEDHARRLNLEQLLHRGRDAHVAVGFFAFLCFQVFGCFWG